MWYDSDIDAVMRRTRNRPIPAGRVTRQEALTFGLVLSVLSVLTLGFVANWAAAALLAFTIFFYVAIYTMWLKRSTPQNIVIGGAAGAFPPMVGALAATGQLSLASLSLFAIIFVWTPPHFWALALVKADDFARAGIPMLPNVKGADRTRRDILSLRPRARPAWPHALAHRLRLARSMASWRSRSARCSCSMRSRVYLVRDGEQADRFAMRMFGFSILYLFLLFAEIVGERALALALPALSKSLCHAMVRPLPIDKSRQGIRLTTAQEKSRRQRNVAIGLAIGLFVLLIYVVTIVKLGPAVLDRPL